MDTVSNSNYNYEDEHNLSFNVIVYSCLYVVWSVSILLCVLDYYSYAHLHIHLLLSAYHAADAHTPLKTIGDIL